MVPLRQSQHDPRRQRNVIPTVWSLFLWDLMLPWFPQDPYAGYQNYIHMTKEHKPLLE